MHIIELYQQIGQTIVDYQTLLSALKNYQNPRNKIGRWLKNGDLIRVKKGLYVFNSKKCDTVYSTEVLANLIYGPSAISLTYALSYYGMIPERVVQITSITNKRNKRFETPAGRFSYAYLSQKKYAMQVNLETAGASSFFIATPEKAIADQIYIYDKNASIDNTESAGYYLTEDMRIDETSLKELSWQKMVELALCYRDPRLEHIAHHLQLRT